MLFPKNVKKNFFSHSQFLMLVYPRSILIVQLNKVDFQDYMLFLGVSVDQLVGREQNTAELLEAAFQEEEDDLRFAGRIQNDPLESLLATAARVRILICFMF